MAHMYMCVGCGCSLLLISVFSLCLRAQRKIDSSIGLPSLNKVVTYLLTYLRGKPDMIIIGVVLVCSCVGNTSSVYSVIR